MTEIVGVLVLVNVLSIEAYHRCKFHRQGHLQRRDSISLCLGCDGARVLERCTKQLLVRFHYVDGHGFGISIPQPRYDRKIIHLEMGKRHQQDFDCLFLVFGGNDDVHVFGSSGFSDPTS